VYGPKLATIRRLFVGSRADLEAMLGAMDARALRPAIDRTLGFDQMCEAYRYFNDRTGFGKVVIVGPSEVMP
jgi:NADPH:quinone reductase-like Zn-dependent oxidoreductase